MAAPTLIATLLAGKGLRSSSVALAACDAAKTLFGATTGGGFGLGLDQAAEAGTPAAAKRAAEIYDADLSLELLELSPELRPEHWKLIKAEGKSGAHAF